MCFKRINMGVNSRVSFQDTYKSGHVCRPRSAVAEIKGPGVLLPLAQHAPLSKCGVNLQKRRTPVEQHASHAYLLHQDRRVLCAKRRHGR